MNSSTHFWIESGELCLIFEICVAWRSAVKYLSKFDIRISEVFISLILPAFFRLFLARRTLKMNEKKLNMNDNSGNIRLVMKMTFRKIPIIFAKFLS